MKLKDNLFHSISRQPNVTIFPISTSQVAINPDSRNIIIKDEIDTPEMISLLDKFPNFDFTYHGENSLPEKYGKSENFSILKLESKSFKSSPIKSKIRAVYSQDARVDKLGERFRLEVLGDSSECSSLTGKWLFYCREQDQSVVSIAALTRIYFRYRCISYVYTPRDFRGKGFARDVLHYMLLDNISEYEGFFLHVNSINLTAIKLYFSLGFRLESNFYRLQRK